MTKAIIIVALTASISLGFLGARTELKPACILKPDTIVEVQKFRERLSREYAEQANQIINYYLIAQRSLYKQEYEKALENINMALNIHKNADLLALKASVYWAMSSFEKARTLFAEAFQLDKDLPLPHLKGLSEWLKKEKLIE